MSEPAKSATATGHRSLSRGIRQFFLRTYAFLILCIVLWTGYTAISYLSRLVFAPMGVPSRYLDPLASGVPVTQPATRGGVIRPIAEPAIQHYHRDPQAFAFTGSAGCTTSGCHSLLPHTKRKEVRAFANFHSTFLDCSSCHDSAIHGPTKAVWLTTRTQRVQGTPALLQLATLIDTRREDIEKNPVQIGTDITALLRLAETDVGVNPALHDILIQLETSEPASPVWRQASMELQTILPNRIRGEYGARITPAAVADQWSGRQSQLADLTRQFQAAALGSASRDQLNKQIHKQVLAKPDACMTCHRDQPSRFDFEQLGYSPQRTATLRDVAMARMIEQIREGRPFHLPGILDRP